jgi:hypothetical protein
MSPRTLWPPATHTVFFDPRQLAWRVKQVDG